MQTTVNNGGAGLSWLALLASAGTLVCCALPIIFVTLGLGATFAALASSFPVLVTLAEYKAWMFSASGGLLLLAGWLLYRSGQACPADPELARLCERNLRWNRRVFKTALVLWAIGFFAAYFALPLRIWLNL